MFPKIENPRYQQAVERISADSDGSSVRERVSAAQLIRAWREDFGIDVTHLFEGVEHLEMQADADTGHIAFSPAILGDRPFYQALRRFKWYHPKTKCEHEFAARCAEPGDFVLDVGAGNGDFATYLADVDYLGLESDTEAVAVAQGRGRELRDLSMKTWRASEEFRPADMVTAFQLLEHVANPKAFVVEMSECLKADGQIVIGVPDADSYVSSLPDFVLNAPPHHVSWWTERSLRRLLAAAGLQVIEFKRFPVESWEYQLWWMAKFAGNGQHAGRSFFGSHLKWRKVLSFCASWPLQWVRPPKSAHGSTLVVRARKPRS